MSSVLKINDSLSWIGALDPNLRTFDIIMETKFGTTYNSYLLKSSEGIAIFETVKDKFFNEYIEKIKSQINPSDISYIIVNHTEPDHAGSVVKLLDYAPNATVVGSALAIKFISQIINKPFNSKIVKDGETLSLGDKTLKFISAPQLHWPDTMYSYIEEDKVLITCDSLGAHYCDENIFKSSLPSDKEDDFLEAFKYYYEMIMGPFKPFVLSALKKIKNLPLSYICPGHGLILDGSNMDKYIALYEKWSTPQKRSIPSIVIPYVSAYGYTEQLAYKIKEGIETSNNNIDVLIYSLSMDNIDQVMSEINQCSGLLIGSPTLVADTLPQVWALLSRINPIINKGIKAGCFGSYGWSGEALKNIEQRFTQLKLPMPLKSLEVVFKPSVEDLERAFKFGNDFANEISTKK